MSELPMGLETRDAIRFQRSVNRDGDCWTWIGCRQGLGYGRMRIRGRTVYAHRVAYALATGNDPAGKVVCHTCDNPACVRPEHLFLGTQSENMIDASTKNRVRMGSRHPCAKLTPPQVIAIRSMIASGRGDRQISRLFGVHPGTIRCIRAGRNWKHLPQPQEDARLIR